MVSQPMRRNRFRQIIKYLRCADNTKPRESDKLWTFYGYGEAKISGKLDPRGTP